MSAEEEVRAAWEDARICSQPKTNGKDRVFWWVLANGKADALCKEVYQSEDETWFGALIFTRKRKQEIAEIEEEIELMELLRGNWGWQAWHPTMERILSRLTAQRDELRKGMKV